MAKAELVAKTQTIIMDVNVVDVNVTTRSKVTEKHVFKDKEPRKAKNVYWLGEKIAVEVVNGWDNSIDLENTNLDRRAIHKQGGTEHNLVKYAKYYYYGRKKIKE